MCYLRWVLTRTSQTCVLSEVGANTDITNMCGIRGGWLLQHGHHKYVCYLKWVLRRTSQTCVLSEEGVNTDITNMCVIGGGCLLQHGHHKHVCYLKWVLTRTCVLSEVGVYLVHA